MGDLEPVGYQPVSAVDHVVIAVVRETAFEPVRRFARAAATEGVGDNDEVAPDVQRLSLLEQLVGQGRPQPVGARARIALQQQYAIDDFAGAVTLRRAEGAIVQFQLRQGLATGEL